MIDTLLPVSDATFFQIKGVVGTVSTVALVIYMVRAWRTFDAPVPGYKRTVGQRMRFISLFMASVLITGASAEQIEQMAEVEWRHAGALIVGLHIFAAAAVSAYEHHHPRRA